MRVLIPTTITPGQLRYVNEGHDEIVEGPGDDDAVVDVQPEHNRHCGVPYPLVIMMIMMMIMMAMMMVVMIMMMKVMVVVMLMMQ